MNNKAVIFDLDGVLIDSMPFHYQAWREAFKRFGIAIAREEIYEREGEKREITAKELYAEHVAQEANADLIKSIIQAKDSIYHRLFRVIFIPGAMNLLSLLKSKNVRIGLVTGATSLDILFRPHIGFLAVFDAIVDGDEPEKGKPAPDPYLIAVRKLGLSTQNCCAVENAPLGIRSAVAANLTCFAVKGPSPLSEETLKGAGAHSVYKDIGQLADHLVNYLLSGN